MSYPVRRFEVESNNKTQYLLLLLLHIS